ncbi:CueP family metal-binding protein [Paraoerskovia marina]|uniref:CueP family metal-binding protein n=1 Tax=Paraoerskovia marina TaxID=545619 RepID=UPI00200AB820|nr:CueP family metal-binding protein [Paraoerskovia marina]
MPHRPVTPRTVIPRPVARRTAALTGALLATVVLLAGCSTPDVSTGNDDLETYGLDGMSAKEMIDSLEATPLDARATDLIASVQPTDLVLKAGSGETTLPLPDDEFYLSVAPYVDETHPCSMHSLTTCTGELGGEEIAVTVVDDASGETLLDETRELADNGFAGLWLPRDIEATLTITHDGKTATAPVTTDENAETCLTTMQLSA